MLNNTEIKRIKKIISIVDFAAVENIELISDNNKIELTIDNIKEDQYNSKNDFLNMLIEGVTIGATKEELQFIKELENMKTLRNNFDTYRAKTDVNGNRLTLVINHNTKELHSYGMNWGSFGNIFEKVGKREINRIEKELIKEGYKLVNCERIQSEYYKSI